MRPDRIFHKFIFCAVIPLSAVCSVPEHRADVVVLGGGIGGLTSAVYLARGGSVPLVIEGKSPGGAIAQSEKVQNWPGDMEISGPDLIRKVREQAEKNGAVLTEEEMVSIDLTSKPFSMIVQDVYDPSKQRKIITDVCIIAMGSNPRTLGVPGEKKYESRGVYTCAVCDGPLYKNKVVAVVGGGDSALLEADYLSGLAEKVYVIVRGSEFRGVENVRKKSVLDRRKIEVIYDTEVKEIQGSEAAVEKIILKNKTGDTKAIAVDAVFLAIGSVPNTQAFAGQLELDGRGYIVCKNHLETSVPGVFAVGDIADPLFKQAVSAGGEGAKAAIQAQSYLSGRTNPSVKLVSEEKVEGQVIEIKSMTHLQEVLKSTKIPVVIDFYAAWCSPCRYLSPFIDTWAKELQGEVQICKVNVDTAQEVAAVYKIMSMPTVLHMDAEGREITRKSGPGEIIRHMNTLKSTKSKGSQL